MRIAVLSGGSPLERGVSLRSAARVEAALTRLGHTAVAIEAGADLVARLRKERPDAAFVAMRGTGGDGTVQELLDILGVAYTGSAAGACERCMDRGQAKLVLAEAGVPTPAWFALDEAAFRELGAADAIGELERRIGFPLVIKPSRGPSSLGLSRVASWYEVPAALIAAFGYDERILLERFVAGPRLEIGLLGGEALGGGAGGAAVGVARAAYEALGCAGPARVELILGDAGPQVIEVDPIPDLGEDSFLSRAAADGGIEFERLIERILDLAVGAGR